MDINRSILNYVASLWTKNQRETVSRLFAKMPVLFRGDCFSIEVRQIRRAACSVSKQPVEKVGTRPFGKLKTEVVCLNSPVILAVFNPHRASNFVTAEFFNI